MFRRFLLPFFTLLFAGMVATSIMSAPGCGRSLFSQVTPTPIPTATITPGTGAFAYVTNFADGTVSEFSRNNSTGALTSIGTTSADRADGPIGVVITPDDTLLIMADEADGLHSFFINQGNGVLSEVTLDSPFLTMFANPQQVASDPNSKFIFATSNGNGSTGGGVTAFHIFHDGTLVLAPSSGGESGTIALLAPIGIAVDPQNADPSKGTATAGANLVFVGDNAAGVVDCFSYDISSGALTLIQTIASGGGGSPKPISLKTDPNGKFLYVSDANGVVSIFSITPGSATPLAALPTVGSTGSTNTFGLVFAPAPSGAGGTDYLLASNQGSGTPASSKVVPFSVGSGGSTLTAQASVSSLSTPTGVAVGPVKNPGFAYIVNQGSVINQIGVYSFCFSGGNVLCSTSNASTGSQPMYIAITP